MSSRRLGQSLLIAACASVAGCAALLPSSYDTGPLRDLPPDLVAEAHVDGIAVAFVGSGRVDMGESDENDLLPYDSDSSGRSTLNVLENEIDQETDRCATGPKRLYMRVRLEEFSFDPRLRSLRDGQGAHVVAGWVNLIDPEIRDGDPVVARYYIRTGARSGNLLERIFTDWRAAAAEEFGRDVCSRIFGRNPRPASDWDNSTPG